jgi:lipid II:glycine glycyltransferase (peptidoglycan interpeptide bridge formation enzyme)
MKVIRKSINEISELEKNQINTFIEQNNGLIFHETIFNEIVSETFDTNLAYFLAYLNSRLVGICPVHSIKRGMLINTYSNNGNIEIPYGGWVFDNKFTNFNSLWNNLSMRLNESITYWSSFMMEIPDKLKRKGKKFQTGLINLNNSEKEIFDEVIHSKRRNMIRKAEKSGIKIKKYGIEGLSIYFNLMHDTYKKANLIESPFNYYEKIFNAYCSTGNVLLIIATLEEKPLAGIIIVGNKNVIHYWQGASISGAPNLGQGELLQWEAIKWAKNHHAKYYDLCVIEMERLPKIAKYKMGFSKKLVPFYCYRKRSFYYAVFNRLQNYLYQNIYAKN